MSDSSGKKSSPEQLTIVALLCALFVCVSPLVKELYPFSMATMFAFPLDKIYVYDARNAQGEQVGDDWFYSHSDNLFDPPPLTLGRAGYGRKEVDKLSYFDSVPPYAKKVSEQELKDFVLSKLKNEPALGYVSVSQNLIEPIREDPEHLNPVWSRTFRMENPFYKQ